MNFNNQKNMLDLTMFMNLAASKPAELVTVSSKGYNKEVTKGDFKILKNGSIIYSEAFRRELAVEQVTKSSLDGTPTETKTVYRFLDFANGEEMKFNDNKGPKALFIAINPYGVPTASIQGVEGKTTYVKDTLIPMLTEIYGINWEETKEIEMSILWDNKIAAAANGKIYMPRVAKNGVPSYSTRDKASLYPCVPTSSLPEQQEAKEPVLEAIQQEIDFDMVHQPDDFNIIESHS